MFIFIVGLAVGSFLNVLIIRLPKSDISKYQHIIGGRSECLRCRKRIIWYDNIPVLSFIILKGRCRSCKSKISWQYPLVEFLTGLLFLATFFVYPADPFFLIYALFLIGLLTVIAFIDLKHFVILDSLILAGFAVSVLSIPKFSNCGIISCSFANSFYGLLFFAGILSLIFLISKGKWLGFGDVKFAALLGLIFGLKGAVNIFYLTFSIGFIIAIMLLALKRAGLKTKIPLGSLMSAAAIFFLLSGFNVLNLIDTELIFRLLWPLK